MMIMRHRVQACYYWRGEWECRWWCPHTAHCCRRPVSCKVPLLSCLGGRDQTCNTHYMMLCAVLFRRPYRPPHLDTLVGCPRPLSHGTPEDRQSNRPVQGQGATETGTRPHPLATILPWPGGQSGSDNNHSHIPIFPQHRDGGYRWCQQPSRRHS